MRKILALMIFVYSNFIGIANDTIVIKDINYLKEGINSNSTIIIECEGEYNNLYLENIENIELYVRSKNFSINLLSISALENAHFNGIKVKQFEDRFKNKSVIFRDSEITMYRNDWILRGQFSFYNCTIKNIANDTFYRSNCSGLKIKNCELWIQGESFNKHYHSGITNSNIYTSSGKLIHSNYNGYYPPIPLKIKSEINIYENDDYYCPSLVEYSASSTLPNHKGISYGVSNLTSYFDENLNAYAWVEGVTGYGVGETINFKFVRVWDEWTFWGNFCIVNGYTKDTLAWKNNARVKTFNVYRNGILIAYLHIEDTMTMQTFNLQEAIGRNEPAIEDVFTFEIAEVYEGDKYMDTTISYFIALCSP